MQAISFVQNNWVSIMAVIGGTVTVFSLIAKMTPTPKDDAWAAKLVKWVDILAINTSRPK
jgi:hypothetical protein